MTYSDMDYAFDLQFFGDGDPTPPANPPEPNKEPDKKPAPDPQKTFTQAGLDKIVEKRLAQERKKYSDYEDVKKELETLKAAPPKPEPDKTDPGGQNPPKPEDKTGPNDDVLRQLETLRKETEALRKEQAAAAEKEKKREREARVVKEFEGYPDGQKANLVLLVKGETDEEIAESVKALKEAFPAPAKPPISGPTNPQRKEIPADSPALKTALEEGKRRREANAKIEELLKI
jgi:hypothetical protein